MKNSQTEKTSEIEKLKITIIHKSKEIEELKEF